MTDEMREALKAATVKGDYLMYKDRPLVREGNTIVYGNIEDEYVLQLIIMNEKEYMGKNVPDKILIQVIDSNDPNKILKQGDKSGLYDAFSLGLVWLERELNAK